MTKAASGSVFIILFVSILALGQTSEMSQLNYWQVALGAGMAIQGPGGIGTVSQIVVQPRQEAGGGQSLSANSGSLTAAQNGTGMTTLGGIVTTSGAATGTAIQTLGSQTAAVPNITSIILDAPVEPNIPAGQNQDYLSGGHALQTQGLQVTGTQSIAQTTGGVVTGGGGGTFVYTLGQTGTGPGTTMTEGLGTYGVQASFSATSPNSQSQVQTIGGILTGQYQQVTREVFE
jgi:hypothetical protein